MVRRAVFILAWVLATMVATGVGLAAVRGVAGTVVDTPASELLGLETSTTLGDDLLVAFPDATLPPLDIGEADGFAVTSTTEVPLVASPEDPPPPRPVPTTVAPTTTTTVTATTTPPDDGESTTPTTTTTTIPPPATTTPEMGETTYHLAGGWVRLTHDDDIVKLDAAGPAPGFTMIITANGPDEVSIAFRSSDHLSRLRAEWRETELQVDVVEAARGR